jgi:hypothetical protein
MAMKSKNIATQEHQESQEQPGRKPEEIEII